MKIKMAKHYSETGSSVLPFGNLTDLVRGFKDSSMRSFTYRENTDPISSEMDFIGTFAGYLLTFPIFAIQGIARACYDDVFRENSCKLKYYTSQSR